MRSASEDRESRFASSFLYHVDCLAAGRRSGVVSRASAEARPVNAQRCEHNGRQRREAEHRARLTYSAYLGFLQLQRQRQAPSLSSEEFEAYVEHVIETLIPSAG